MAAEAWIVLAVVLGVFASLVWELASPATTMVAAMVIVLVTGVVTPEQALSGFSNPAPITVAALYVLARAVEKTGVLTTLVNRMLGAGNNHRAALTRLVVPTAAASAFLNNTPIVAMLLPNVQAWAAEKRLSPSKFLMPLSFAALLGGVTTLIGTSTNIVVSGLMVEAGLGGLGFFELSPVGVPIAVIGVLLLIALAPIALPERLSVRQEADAEARQFMTEMVVDPGGPLDGKPVAAAGLRHLSSVFLATIERDGSLIAPVGPDELLRGGDRLRFVGKVQHVVDLPAIRGLTAEPSDHLLDLDTASARYFEAVVGAESPLVGQTLKEADFRRRYQGVVMAIHRAGQRVDAKLGEVPLRVGDTLLILSDQGFRRRWEDRPDFLLISQQGATPNINGPKAVVVGLVALGIIGLASAGVVPILEASLMGGIVLIAARVLTPSEARSAIDLDVIVLIASAFGVAHAIEASGLAQAVASGLVDAFEFFGPRGILTGVVLATVVMTSVITNNAAALLMFPIAIAAAESAGLNPRGFAVAVAIAASVDFLTPIGYQTNTMVYGPGGYRFGDYSRLGAPLTLAVVLTVVALVPIVWGA
ncbi:MAG TPA: SLC13 family permease [Acidimicrobiia bacterium]|nr:SLC13 family permease [Acidimicrobiia bacterium]